jgi:hypothetical protein
MIEPKTVEVGSIAFGVIVPPTVTRFGANFLAMPKVTGMDRLISKSVVFGVSTITHLAARTSFTFGWWIGEFMDLLGMGSDRASIAIAQEMEKSANQEELDSLRKVTGPLSTEQSARIKALQAMPGIKGVMGRRFGMESGGVTGRMFQQEAGGVIGRRFEMEAGGVTGEKFGQEAGQIADDEVEALRALKQKLEMGEADGVSYHVLIRSR